jgi:hypothetical protein
MNHNSWIGGLILILIGLYFFLKELNVPLLNEIASWPMILILIGLFFMISSLSNKKQRGSIFPGIILLGLGAHFLGQDLIAGWPTHWAVYTFVVSIAFFGQYLVSGERGSIVPALILLAISLSTTVLSETLHDISWSDWWPVILIILGVVILFRGISRR